MDTCDVLHHGPREANGGGVLEQALRFGVIRPLRSCPDSFGCLHIHFEDTVPPSPDLRVRGMPDATPRVVDGDVHATLTLTISETAQLLGISLSKAYEAARLGQIRTIRLGTRILVSRHRLEEIVNGYVQ